MRGNAVFTAEFIGENRRAGTLFFVHPMEEDGSRFLPCCYGYGTTIRRAQGASLVQGCLWFDQHKHAAGRGYGYVGVSRFRSGDCGLAGCDADDVGMASVGAGSFGDAAAGEEAVSLSDFV